MNQSFKKSKVQYLHIRADDAEQRIDNFLINYLKGMPKSRIYRLLRKGEVRINKKRISPFYRLQINDKLRLPPVFLEDKAKQIPPSKDTEKLLANRILYEDQNLLIINKPPGMSVHVGSTVRIGVIEALRHMYPKLPNLELAHRLDSETSGCLILAKKKRILRELHEMLRNGEIKKIYWALTKGKWEDNELRVELPLNKEYRDGGKHVVEVHRLGKPALTEFQPLSVFKQASLMEVRLHTGRTHQIRVHAQHQGHPIAGDDRYGDPEFNKLARHLGLKRMFLHARSVDFLLPSENQRITVIAPLDPELELGLNTFENRGKLFMDLKPQTDEVPQQPEKISQRGIYLLPNLLTTAALFAGFYSIVAAMKGNFETAAIAIFVAMIVDGLDGRVARLTNTQTAFGAQYDSLSDMAAFGIAPALVVFSWSLFHLGKIGWLVAFLYTAATALRLARFNTQVVDKNYFQGLPSPSAAGVVTSLVWLGSSYDMDGPAIAVPVAVLTILAAGLMVSTMRYHSFKTVDFKGRVPFFSVVLAVLIIAGIALNPPEVLFGLFFIYMFSGPIFTLIQLRKMRKQRKG